MYNLKYSYMLKVNTTFGGVLGKFWALIFLGSILAGFPFPKEKPNGAIGQLLRQKSNFCFPLYSDRLKSPGPKNYFCLWGTPYIGRIFEKCLKEKKSVSGFGFQNTIFCNKSGRFWVQKNGTSDVQIKKKDHFLSLTIPKMAKFIIHIWKSEADRDNVWCIKGRHSYENLCVKLRNRYNA